MWRHTEVCLDGPLRDADRVVLVRVNSKRLRIGHCVCAHGAARHMCTHIHAHAHTHTHTHTQTCTYTHTNRHTPGPLPLLMHARVAQTACDRLNQFFSVAPSFVLLCFKVPFLFHLIPSFIIIDPVLNLPTSINSTSPSQVLGGLPVRCISQNFKTFDGLVLALEESFRFSQWLGEGTPSCFEFSRKLFTWPTILKECPKWTAIHPLCLFWWSFYVYFRFNSCHYHWNDVWYQAGWFDYVKIISMTYGDVNVSLSALMIMFTYVDIFFVWLHGMLYGSIH